MSLAILIARAALQGVLDAGRGALPQETGGILLGFRTPDAIVITRTLVVPDPSSTGRSYLRRNRRARRLMADASTEAPPVVGYVGEWHTHPADAPPSRTDRSALTATARLGAGPVALLVPAYPPTGPAHVHGLVAERRPWPVPAISPVDLAWADVQPMPDTPESLEAEAAALLPEPEGHR